MKLKMCVKISLFIILLIGEVILYACIGNGLSELEILLYTIGLINTSFVIALGIHISEEMGYK